VVIRCTTGAALAVTIAAMTPDVGPTAGSVWVQVSTPSPLPVMAAERNPPPCSAGSDVAAPQSPAAGRRATRKPVDTAIETQSLPQPFGVTFRVVSHTTIAVPALSIPTCGEVASLPPSVAGAANPDDRLPVAAPRPLGPAQATTDRPAALTAARGPKPYGEG
jgi:hypothetical protein